MRKNISVQKGEQVLFDEISYLFYITNRVDYTGEQIVSLANGRCNQENVIEQLKNGVNAMRMPVDDLFSNWAYMVMTSLAWNLKAWFGLLLPNSQRGLDLIRMEFRRFLHAIVLLPAQIVRTGRRVIYRIMSYNGWLKDLFGLGAPALAPCHLAKQNDPDPHHNLCQQEANYTPILPQSASSARCGTPKFAFEHPAAPCGSVTKIAVKDLEKYDPRDAGALRAGFSLILGLVYLALAR